jgi:hypothetical protein
MQLCSLAGACTSRPRPYVGECCCKKPGAGGMGPFLLLLSHAALPILTRAQTTGKDFSLNEARLALLVPQAAAAAAAGNTVAAATGKLLQLCAFS